MGKLARLIDTLRRRPDLPFHDFGYAESVDREAIHAGLRQVADMRYLQDHLSYVRGFEREFAKRLGVPHAIGMASGTHALYLALKQAGAGPGKEVITVANTWITTLTAVAELGAACRFIDIDPLTGLMDPARIEAAITPDTVAILPVHMYGSMVPMPAVIEIGRRRGLAVIEDACQAIGASLHGQAAGTWGDAGCFSFHTTKLVGAPGDGGMLVTRRSDWAGAFRKDATVCWEEALVTQQARVPSRLPALSVPFLKAGMARLGARIAARMRQCAIYHDALRDLPGARLLVAPPGVSAAYRNCILVSPYKKEIVRACRRARIPVEEIYPQSRAFVERLSRQGCRLPATLELATSHVSLPIGRQMTPREMDRVIAIVSKAARQPAAAR